MEIRVPSYRSSLPIQTHLQSPSRHLRLPSRLSSFPNPHRLSIYTVTTTFPTLRTACTRPGHGIQLQKLSFDGSDECIIDEGDPSPSSSVASQRLEAADSASIWAQVKEIVLFAGPATGLWICGPLMSLIDTAVIGQGSSLELAALGPGTVVCDYLSYAFMFLSIATSNMVATALARKDKNLVQHQISMMLFVSSVCGLGMLIFTKFMGAQMIAASVQVITGLPFLVPGTFTGPRNMHMVPAANTYVQIRGLAWPALLVGMVAQSASLGMKDSWGPLKALAVAGVINGLGDILLCSVLGYGIAGAAWATMVAQVIAAFMMIENLNRTGFSAFSLSIPSPNELLQIFELAAPVFITMTSKVAFYSLLTYFATSLGTTTIAAHQVMIGVFCLCTVWGEPLSQTAQSFMPEFLCGIHRNLMKAWMLLRSLVIIGACTGVVLGTVGTSVPWFFPYAFTTDYGVIEEMRKVLLPYFVALIGTPSIHSLEGTLLAGRDLKFLSISMSGCFIFGSLLLLLMTSGGCGLQSCWWALAGFQWARFSLALLRLLSPRGILYSDQLNQDEIKRLEAT